MNRRRAVFLDRDGVILENKDDYIRSWGEVRFMPGVFTPLRQLSRSKYVLVLVTNQSVVGRGIISLDEAMRINQQVIKVIASRGEELMLVISAPIVLKRVVNAENLRQA